MDVEQSEVRAVLAQLKELENNWILSVPAHPLPELNVRFDLRDRQGDRIRTIKYVQQTCSAHIEHIRSSNAVKIAYLLSGFRSMSETQNIYGLHYFARAALELLAFLYELKLRLEEIAVKSDEDFVSKGHEFFSLAVRARYATSDPRIREVLKQSGISERMLKPLNAMNCLKALATSEAYAEMAARYDELCDFVHHNASSHAAGSAGLIKGQGIMHSSGGGMMMPANGHWSIYQYPVPTKEVDALSRTVPLFLRIMRAIGNVLNSLRRGPFEDGFLIKETGNRFAMQVLHNPNGKAFSLEHLTNGYKPRYNDLCPCGSARTYKRCCLNRRHIGEEIKR